MVILSLCYSGMCVFVPGAAHEFPNSYRLWDLDSSQLKLGNQGLVSQDPGTPWSHLSPLEPLMMQCHSTSVWHDNHKPCTKHTGQWDHVSTCIQQDSTQWHHQMACTFDADRALTEMRPMHEGHNPTQTTGYDAVVWAHTISSTLFRDYYTFTIHYFL